MKWNWQKSDWPHFSWKVEVFSKAEQHFILAAGTFLGTVKHLSVENLDQLKIEVLSTEAVTTSEIEGEILDRASVQSSIRRELGLKTDNRRVEPAARGVAEMMVDLYQSFAVPLSNRVLFNWHEMLMMGRNDITDVGKYRTHHEPMQVVSGSLHKPSIHFQAPPSSEMKSEMSAFTDWFNRTANEGKESLPALVRAGIAHLYFVSIHPFEDGNGRIARAISEKALSQNLGHAALIGLSAQILSKRKAYYDALEAANKNNEITAWLIWFAETVLEAQQRTAVMVEFLVEKTKLLDRVRGQLNERQEKVLLRVLQQGPAGFKGGLSAGNYIGITKTSPATAGRDLIEMVDKGILVRTGQRRHARYRVQISSKPLSVVKISSTGEVAQIQHQ